MLHIHFQDMYYDIDDSIQNNSDTQPNNVSDQPQPTEIPTVDIPPNLTTDYAWIW